MLVDTHVHFDGLIQKDPVEAIIARAAAAGVKKMVAVGGSAEANEIHGYDPAGDGTGRCTLCHMPFSSLSAEYVEDADGHLLGDVQTAEIADGLGGVT